VEAAGIKPAQASAARRPPIALPKRCPRRRRHVVFEFGDAVGAATSLGQALVEQRVTRRALLRLQGLSTERRRSGGASWCPRPDREGGRRRGGGLSARHAEQEGFVLVPLQRHTQPLRGGRLQLRAAQRQEELRDAHDGFTRQSLSTSTRRGTFLNATQPNASNARSSGNIGSDMADLGDSRGWGYQVELYE
jgi:hypothetical protein